MKAVMPSVPPEILAWRKRTGAHQRDEMWDGVLHMPPEPNRHHQDLEGSMETFLRTRWARPRRCKVYHRINLALPGRWPDDFRIPDLVLLTPERFFIDKNEYFEGAPAVVVEIYSPGDEAYEKLEFFARLGVPEVWIVHRDTKEAEIHALEGGVYKKRAAESDGWICSDVAGIELKAGMPGKLAVRLAGDDSTREDLPED